MPTPECSDQEGEITAWRSATTTCRLGRLSHQVDHPRLGRKVEVQVTLRAPVVGVRRHRVPHRTRVEPGDPHDDLAGLDAVLVDVLVKRSPIAGGLVTELADRSMARQDQLGGKVAWAGALKR